MAKKTDQQKGLRYLSRSELIEIIYRQQLLLDDLQQRLADSKEKCGELTEQIRNFEANRSLSAHTERLDADIQSMAKQLDILNDIIRRNYASGNVPASQSPAPVSRSAASAPPPPVPPPPAAGGRHGAGPMAPPIPRRHGRSQPAANEQTPAPTIAQQLNGQPFRADADN